MSHIMGKKIFISREESKAQDFIGPLERHGAQIFAQSLITFELRHSKLHENLLRQLSQYEWLVFTSTNGVKYFFETLNLYEIPKDEIYHLKIASVGSKTQESLEQNGIKVDFVPEIFDAEHFSQAFITEAKPSNVLLVKGNLSRQVIDRKLDEELISYETITVYNTVFNEQAQDDLQHIMKHSIDAWTFTSPSSIDAFIYLQDSFEGSLSKPCFCIGHTTQQKAKEVGFTETYVPKIFTLEGLAHEVIDFYSRKGES
ncbi:uroporphyrinogen-III synthase [Piscibacillus halophilus]|uniref:Uroporphyrinogen-III synthase n=1 Tax=Piscibacillus halophilus TaxID=571933 RepID=A0A1H9BYQ0_9BACI|nr:uroporphyrinogen-III synthase [Piscibacillus halophilus]SEP94090.1 uroporphyrinogen-III synthase [Piscibacillus halophilus]